jgi:hypothetical protein
MGDFGKRNVRHSAPRQHAPRAQQEATPQGPDLISKRDLKALERGRMPVWTNMSQMKLVGFALLMAAMAFAALAFYGPEVARDLRNAGTYDVAYDLRATEGTCRRYVFLVSLCSAEIHAAGSGQSVSSTRFLMFFNSGDGAAMIPVRSSADASAVGIQYAVSDVLLNRILSLLGVTLSFGWMTVVFLNCLRSGRYQDGPAHEALAQYLALRSTAA